MKKAVTPKIDSGYFKLANIIVSLNYFINAKTLIIAVKILRKNFFTSQSNISFFT